MQKRQDTPHKNRSQHQMPCVLCSKYASLSDCCRIEQHSCRHKFGLVCIHVVSIFVWWGHGPCREKPEVWYLLTNLLLAILLPQRRNEDGRKRPNVFVVQWIAITSERREVPAVPAARASPAMGLEVQEVRPTETPRQTGTVYLPATTVPPTVVALRP